MLINNPHFHRDGGTTQASDSPILPRGTQRGRSIWPPWPLRVAGTRAPSPSGRGVFCHPVPTGRAAQTRSLIPGPEHLSTAAPVSPAPPNPCPAAPHGSGGCGAHLGSQGTWPYPRWNQEKRVRWCSWHESRAGSQTPKTPLVLTREASTSM